MANLPVTEENWRCFLRQEVESQISNKTDVLVAILHWILIEKWKLRCLDSEREKLPTSYNTDPGSYCIMYKHKKKHCRLTCEVKKDEMQVVFLNCDSDVSKEFKIKLASSDQTIYSQIIITQEYFETLLAKFSELVQSIFPDLIAFNQEPLPYEIAASRDDFVIDCTLRVQGRRPQFPTDGEPIYNADEVASTGYTDLELNNPIRDETPLFECGLLLNNPTRNTLRGSDFKVACNDFANDNDDDEKVYNETANSTNDNIAKFVDMTPFYYHTLERDTYTK